MPLLPTYVHALTVRVWPHRADPGIASALAKLPHVAATDVELETMLEDDAVVQTEVAQLVEYSPTHWLVEAELDEIDARRRAFGFDPVVADGEPLARACNSDLVGLCCSGGGIRSATFALGVLQGLAEKDVLRRFDYLSSVSGGGYIHQWLAGWIRRRAPGRDAAEGVAAFNAVNAAITPAPDSGRRVEPAQIHWLRRYSNYLTPERGLFTADTWVGLATWFRNTVLNQIALVSALFVVLAVPQFLTLHPSRPRLPDTMAAPIGIAAVALVALAAVATAFVSFHVGHESRHDRFDETDVQLYIVVPMLVWSVIVTLLQNAVEAAFPNPALATAAFAFGAIASIVLAFGGGALAAYVETHHGGWDEWRAARADRTARFLRLRLLAAILGIVLAAVVTGTLGAMWMVYVPPAIVGALSQWFHTYVPAERVTLVIGPPLYLMAPVLGVVLLTGLLGRTFHDERREWLARLLGWTGMYAAGWALLVGASLLGGATARALQSVKWSGWSALVSWAAVSLGGVLSGMSASTKAQGESGAKGSSWLSWDTLATVAPYVFVAGLLLLVGWAAEAAVRWASVQGGVYPVLTIALPLVAAVVTGWRVDINEFSMHAFYRDRLARCYLGASNDKRQPNAFTGFDSGDADGSTKLAKLRASEGYFGPYPIFCTALNLIVGQDLAWQERKAASFMFSPIASGYDLPPSAVRRARSWLRYSGFVRTGTYAYVGGPHMKTAVAISGAALSPNWGYHTDPATAFLMTLFNVRLGWWLRNPRRVTEHGANRAPDGGRPKPTPTFALLQLGRELLGQIDNTSDYVYLSDGGHFDNMGLYELVRRQCRYIVVCDGEEDRDRVFDGLAMAIRKCRTDFGVDISLDLRPLRQAAESPYSGRHLAAGTITYPGSAEKGVVLYLKASLTGDEPADIIGYQCEHNVFPNDTTVDQWFTESQFESYRRLGLHVIHTALAPVQGGGQGMSHVRDWFDTMRIVWYPPTPEMEAFHAAHTQRYDALLQQIRTDARLTGLLPLLCQGRAPTNWMAQPPADRDFALLFVVDLFEFAWSVFSDLQLVYPHNLEHPHALGWVEIFGRWWAVDVIHDAWVGWQGQYSTAFRLFVENSVNGGSQP